MSVALSISFLEPSENLGPKQIGTIFCDVGDMLFYLRHHQNASGIQRVIMSVVGAVAEWDGEGPTVTWCAIDPIANEMRGIDKNTLVRLVDEVSNNRDLSRSTLDALVEEATASAFVLNVASGDTFVILGAFWVFNHASAMFSKMRWAGARTVLIVYDIIPLQYPEYCERDLTAVFSQQMRSILPLLDCAITISEHVAEQFRIFVERSGASLPVLAAPLGHDKLTTSLPSNVSDLLDFQGEYVLAVGTIEIRKNHIFLFNVWKHLLATRDPDQVPRLVLVGRRGWRVADLIAQFDATDLLDGHIVVLESISDGQLDDLYANCLFTTFVSFCEGWGLPVGESLSRGKLCVASNATSIPEIGGNLPIYVDPHNVSAGIKVFERLLDDRAYLAERTAAIQTGFKPRSWAVYTHGLFGLISTVKLSKNRKRAAALAEGRWLTLSNRGRAEDSADTACVQGWFAPEDWGRWSSAREAIVEFQANPDMRYRLVMDVSMPPWMLDHGMRLSGPGLEPCKITVVPPGGATLTTLVKADRDGLIALRIRTIGDKIVTDSDLRVLYVGMRKLIFYSVDDPIRYMQGVEHLSLAALGATM